MGGEFVHCDSERECATVIDSSHVRDCDVNKRALSDRKHEFDSDGVYSAIIDRCDIHDFDFVNCAVCNDCRDHDRKRGSIGDDAGVVIIVNYWHRL